MFFNRQYHTVSYRLYNHFIPLYLISLFNNKENNIHEVGVIKYFYRTPESVKIGFFGKMTLSPKEEMIFLKSYSSSQEAYQAFVEIRDLCEKRNFAFLYDEDNEYNPDLVDIDF